MDTPLTFRILLPALLVAFAAYRGYCTRKYGRPSADTVKQREPSLASRIADLLSLPAFAAVVVYAVAPSWLAWAALPLPAWLRWAGLGVALAGFALLHWAHTALNHNWSDTPRLLKNQVLVTHGPYRWVRHPIYTGFLLILGSTLLISANALIGGLWLGLTALEVAARIRFEEALMLTTFGEQYRAYQKTTGALLPPGPGR